MHQPFELWQHPHHHTHTHTIRLNYSCSSPSEDGKILQTGTAQSQQWKSQTEVDFQRHLAQTSYKYRKSLDTTEKGTKNGNKISC